MTCLEKYRQEHPEKSVEYILAMYCPHCSGRIDIAQPDYCLGDNGNPECHKCWNREVPVADQDSKTKKMIADFLETGVGVTRIPDNEEVQLPHTEAVDHPKHYGREGAMECIEEMILVFGVKATMCFCLLNAWKYRYRAADKGGEEDMKKSDWYMAKYKELKEAD